MSPGPCELPDYWIDKFEVTNREFKKFVDAGGYSERSTGRNCGATAYAVLRSNRRWIGFATRPDATGPATWELGSYPEGQDDYPVAGISWFEAAAYARFAGKSLPTLYHWRAASGMDDIFSDVLRVSQFDAKGPAKVGERQSVGPWGTLDMAGNVQEWSAQRIRQHRAPLHPRRRLERSDVPLPRAGGAGSVGAVGHVRSAPDQGGEERRRLSRPFSPIEHVEGDPHSLVPVSDDSSSCCAAFTPTTAVRSTRRWNRPTTLLSIGGRRPSASRLPTAASAFPRICSSPKHVKPPYQTVVYFPSSYAREVPSSK